jgi:hypothetical protein
MPQVILTPTHHPITLPPASGAAQCGCSLTSNLVSSRLNLVLDTTGGVLGLVQDALMMLGLRGKRGKGKREHGGGGGG